MVTSFEGITGFGRKGSIVIQVFQVSILNALIIKLILWFCILKYGVCA